jgi:hypothetical protein
LKKADIAIENVMKARQIRKTHIPPIETASAEETEFTKTDSLAVS